MNAIRLILAFPVTSRHSNVRLCAEWLLCIAVAAAMTFALISGADVLEQRDTALRGQIQAQAKLDAGYAEAHYWIAKWEKDVVVKNVLGAK